MVESEIMEANTEAEIMEEVDTFENDVEYANKDEEPPDPGICPTFAVLAGGGDFSLDILNAKSDLGLLATNLELTRVHPEDYTVVIQQPPPEVGGDYRHGPHQAVGQANNKEALENEEDDETDTLVVSDTGASVECQHVMHEMEVDDADKVTEIR